MIRMFHSQIANQYYYAKTLLLAILLNYIYNSLHFLHHVPFGTSTTAKSSQNRGVRVQISGGHILRYWLSKMLFASTESFKAQRANNLWTDSVHILLWKLFGWDFSPTHAVYQPVCSTHQVGFQRKQEILNCLCGALMVCRDVCVRTLCFCLSELN